MSLNKDAQPINKNINRKRNYEKSICGLKGILEGISADGKLSKEELFFLDIWLKNEDALKADGDVVDLLDQIGEILVDGVVTPEELLELKSLIDDIIKYKEISISSVDSKINELIGILTGIASDNIVTASEIESLSEWMSNNPEISDQWPATAVIKRLYDIFEDGVISDDERLEFLETIKQITGLRFNETGLAQGLTTEFFEDEIHNVIYENKCYCFSGTFVSGARSAVENKVINKGATAKKDVTKKVDYLVIGTLASRDWMFSSHGRKIEKALKMKEDGHSIKIITERNWLKIS